MKTVAVSGYFDPLHIGHLQYLKMASGLGDKLIIILNNENQTILKRKTKPFMPIEDRVEILEELKCVDKVFISIDEDLSVCDSLRCIEPDIFAKGGDRYAKEIPEAKICKELGIKIIDGVGSKIQSSSELIK